MISLIWANDSVGGIGFDNRLPWHFKKDLKFFKQQTENKTVLVSENTYLSLKSYYKTKPLPYGRIIVATLNDNFEQPEDVYDTVNDAEHFLRTIDSDDELIVIGGRSIYEISVKYADRLIQTIIEHDFSANVKLSDEFFQTVENNFDIVSESGITDTNTIDSTEYLLRFLVLDKK